MRSTLPARVAPVRESPRMPSCSACGAGLPPSAISQHLGAARCPACRALVDLGAPPPQPPPPVPAGWLADFSPGATLVQWRWFTAATVFLLFFSILWNGLLLVMAFSASKGFTEPQNLLVGVVVPHVWAGVVLAYVSVAQLLNRTTVRLEHGLLSISHAPLWWPGRRVLDARELAQLFVVEQRGGRGRIRYQLGALLRDGKRLALLTVDSAEQAHFLERRLEQALGIVDQPVEGEHR